MWRVRGHILGAVASSIHPLLSSKRVECAVVQPTISLVALESSMRREQSGRRSLVD